MDGKGRALDNRRIERFFRSYKWEKLYLEEYETGHQLRRITKEYIDYYNCIRPHQSHNYNTPKDVYDGICPSNEVFEGRIVGVSCGFDG
jgi:putative transposase